MQKCTPTHFSDAHGYARRKHNAASLWACIRACIDRAFLHNWPMEADPEIVVLEQLAKSAALNMSDVLRTAGVSQSTWFRWRLKGVEPRVGTLRRVREAITEATASQVAA